MVNASTHPNAAKALTQIQWAHFHLGGSSLNPPSDDNMYEDHTSKNDAPSRRSPAANGIKVFTRHTHTTPSSPASTNTPPAKPPKPSSDSNGTVDARKKLFEEKPNNNSGGIHKGEKR